jgi:hypothetical protein
MPEPPLIKIYKKDERGETGNFYIKAVVDLKIDKRRKDLKTRKKGCLMYKIQYLDYGNYNIMPE